MRIAAFDIGIRNLSFIILSYDPNENDGKFIIEEWVNIDLHKYLRSSIENEQIFNKYRCTSMLKRGNAQCNSTKTLPYSSLIPDVKILRSMLKKDLESIYDNIRNLLLLTKSNMFKKYQEREGEEGKNVNKKEPTKIVRAKTKSQLCEEIEKLRQRAKELYCCRRHYEQEILSISAPNAKLLSFTDALNKEKAKIKKLCSAITEIDIGTALVTCLDNYPVLRTVPVILIELQMRKDMICVAAQLKNYLITRCIIDIPEEEVVLKEIIDVHASKKLCLYDGPELSCHLKDKHSRNKWFAKEHCKYIIRDRPEYLELYEKEKKKDDLSDCFLMALYYLCVQKYRTMRHVQFNDPSYPHKKRRFYRRSAFRRKRV